MSKYCLEFQSSRLNASCLFRLSLKRYAHHLNNLKRYRYVRAPAKPGAEQRKPELLLQQRKTERVALSKTGRPWGAQSDEELHHVHHGASHALRGADLAA